ncbi:hypothetical protein ACFLS1_01115 [Verrucomicrobiota bacterium]
MKTLISGILITLCIMLLSSNTLSAGSFDRLIVIKEIEGRCFVRLPGASSEIKAERDKRYPYGTRIKTGPESSISIQLNSDNEFEVSPNSSFVIAEDAKDSKLKKILLDEGKIKVLLEKSYQDQTGNRLNVESSTVVCESTGGSFTINVMTEPDMRVVMIMCEKGDMKVFNPYFEIPVLEENESVSVGSTFDRTYTKVADEKGKYEINLKTPEEVVTKEMEEGSLIRIFTSLSESGDAILVAIIPVAPDGTAILPALRFRKEIAVAGKDEEKPEEKLDEEGKTEDEQVAEIVVGAGWPVITVRSTTTTTTTTTTLPEDDKGTLMAFQTAPSPTPIGKRYVR